MISSFVKKLFLTLLFIVSSCQSKDTCNDSCLTKKYSYKDGDKDSVSVTFTAKQLYGINYLTINLVGYNIKETEDQLISVSFKSDTAENKYSCERNPIGSTVASFSGVYGQSIEGSSMYQDNTLYCYWIISRETSIWPRDANGNQLDLEFNSNYEILIGNSQQTLMVAVDIRDLPIYQLQFLKCCNIVHGNDQFQLTAIQTDKSNDFNILYKGYTSTIYTASVKLTGSDSIQLDFDCYLTGSTIDGHLKSGGQSVLINSQFLSRDVLPEGLCTWSIPLSIKGLTEDYDTRNHVYDLKILENGNIVYTESGVSLKSSGATHISNIFIVISAFLASQMIL